MITANLHDGRVLEFPDGTDPAVVQRVVRQTLGISDKPEQTFPEKLGQQVLNAGAGALRGAGSIGATFLTPYDLIAGNTKTIGNPERRRAMDEALQSLGADTEGLAYGAGKLGTEIAGTMGVGGALAKGASAIPMLAGKAPGLIQALSTSGMKAGGLTGLPSLAARSVGGAAAGGAAAGLVNPEDAGMGAGVGAALPGGLQLAGKAMHALGSAMRPSVANAGLADKAINKYNIPLGVSDISASGMVKGARSALDDSWIVGGIGRKRKEAVQEAFNRSVGDTFGAGNAKLTPQVMDAAKKRMGAEFDRVWGQNPLKIDAGLIQDVQRIEADAVSKLNPEQSAQVSRQIQSLLQKAQGLDIDGSFANNWQSELRMVADSEKGLHQKLLKDLRGSVISAFNRSITPSDAAALTANRGQYKAFKTVEPLLQKAEAGAAGREVGDVSAGLLPEAVRQSYRSNIAGSPFADLTQIGSQFVADRVPRTGGSARAAVQNVAIGGGLMANPALTGAGLGGAFGLEMLLSSPSMAKRMIQQNPGLLSNPDFQALLYRSIPVAAAGQ